MAVNKFKYQIEMLASNKSKKHLEGFKKDIGSVNSVVSQLRNTIVAAFSVREIVNAANVMIGVENRMNALTGSAEKTGIAMDHMRRIAADSRSDFDAVAMLYTRLALATEHLGATQRDVADATQTVANTFIIAGSHAQEANNSARQLAQGLASGALRGDELRSVMENNTILTKMLADGFKMTIGELREFGHAGKLTAEKVMPILIAGTKQTNDEIAKMPMTLGQAGVALRNNFQFMIGDIEKLSRSFSKVSAVIGHFANNMDAILIPILVAVPFAIYKIATAFKVLTAVIMANPFVLIATAIAVALTSIYIFRAELVHVFNLLSEKWLPTLALKIKLFAKKMYSSFHDFFLIPLKQGMAFAIDSVLSKVNMAITGVNKLLSFLNLDEIPTIDLIGNVSTEKNRNASDIAKILSDIEKVAGKEIKKMEIPSIMDMLLGRDPNAAAGDDGTGFKELTKLEQFLKDAEKGFGKFQTSIKTMQDELQGVFKKSYDGLTKLTMDFLEKGKASFKDYATSIVRELIRIAVQKLIIDRMFGAIGKSIGNMRDDFQYNRLTDGDTLFDENYDGGGYTGSGVRAGGLDGKGGFPAMLHPNETVIDHAKGQSVGGGSPTVNFNISTIDAAGFDQLLASRKGLITSIINNAMNNQGKMGIV